MKEEIICKGETGIYIRYGYLVQRNMVDIYLTKSKMWSTEEKLKYNFLLSPDTFGVNEDQVLQLEKFSKKLCKFFKIKTGKFPVFCKVDLMINKDGDLKIAEIDGLNKRAFGYAVLERKIAKMFDNGTSSFFSGIENSVKRIIGTKKLFIIVPGREKYYKYGFNFLVEALREVGVEASWGHEKEAIKFLSSIDPNSVVLLDIPITENVKLDSLLTEINWDVLIPNEPFFSSKANLVDLKDPLVPVTLNGSGPNPFKTWVTKHISKSGCKGVSFSDEMQKIDSQKINDEYIIQEYVEGKKFSFTHFESTDGLRYTWFKSDGWHVRLIATLDLKSFKIVDIDVTARQDRLVHGASDSIQIAGVKVWD